MHNSYIIMSMYNPSYTDTPTFSLTLATIIKKLPDALGVLCALITGAFITFLTQKYLKLQESKYTVLNNSHYVSLLLCQERANLKQIEIFLEYRKNKRPHQKVFIFPSSFEIKQDNIEKILIHKAFFKHNYANVIQSLIASEQAYRKCYKLLRYYNDSIQKLLEESAHNGEKSTLLEKIYTEEIIGYVDNISNKYNEAIKLNEQAKFQLDTLCCKVFKKLYNPLKTDGIIPAKEIFESTNLN